VFLESGVTRSARLLQFGGRVASTDRAFRALARAEPGVVLALLRLALPDFMPGVTIDQESVEDPKLDLPPPREADLVARAGERDVLHVEGQGYGEKSFDERVFRYHLLLVLRHPTRTVNTVALWLVPPRPEQRLKRIERPSVAIDVHTVVLQELPASRLLADPDAVCFASGADPEGRSALELCRSVAHALRAQGASWQRLLVSAAVAAAAGRYHAMVQAMQEAQLDPPIIEDLVLYGRDCGFREGLEAGRREGVEAGRREGVEAGRREGLEEGQRRALLVLLAARGLSVTAEERARVEAEHNAERLLEWLRRAAVATSTNEVFA
jgi:hypothetical protein